MRDEEEEDFTVDCGEMGEPAAVMQRRARKARAVWITRHVLRAFVATHFLAELYSKTVHPGFSYWEGEIRDSDMPAPGAELGLVILLLTVGSVLLIAGVYLPAAAGCLTLFQVPTTIVFEDSWYERMKSISVIAGLLHVTLTEEFDQEGVGTSLVYPSCLEVCSSTELVKPKIRKINSIGSDGIAESLLTGSPVLTHSPLITPKRRGTPRQMWQK